MKNYEAIGVIEVKNFTNALKILDSVCKGCDVELLNTENKLGGRLISIIFAGDISNIKSSIEIGYECVTDGSIKNAICITRPHSEIMKFIVPQKKTRKKTVKKNEVTILQPEIENTEADNNIDLNN